MSDAVYLDGVSIAPSAGSASLFPCRGGRFFQVCFGDRHVGILKSFTRNNFRQKRDKIRLKYNYNILNIINNYQIMMISKHI